MPQPNTAVVLFRRDLRLHDNTALLRACEESTDVIPVFILDPRQAQCRLNKCFSARAFAFLASSLQELRRDIHEHGGSLRILVGHADKVLPSFLEDVGASSVYANYDYTPFARERDKSLEQALAQVHASFIRTHDYTLAPVTSITTQSNKPYTVFTPFMRNAMQHTVSKPHRFAYKNLARTTHGISFDAVADLVEATKASLSLEPGRAAARRILQSLSELETYHITRDRPAQHGTSRLSPHLKFGTVSVREVYHKATERPFNTDQFIAELYWRDFYLHIAYHFPKVFGTSFLPWGDNISWRNERSEFEAWKRGETGIPIVDAGMRELNETGWMHNRARMIVASFLTKHLLIDWRWGERYFATQLIDYDPSSNNGGWQWSASVGADPRPLRIFNPYTQAQKYDPDARYIKQWVPELHNVDSSLLTDGKTRDFSTLAPNYPAPIVDHKQAYHRAREVYRAAK